MVKFRNNWGQDLWDSMLPRSTQSANATAKAVDKILTHKDQYKIVESMTGVPWYWIAITHRMENNNDFRGVLHNGQRIIGTGKKTTIVPKGRGPFDTWEEAAIDAIQLKGLDKITDWNLNRTLYEFERYNGFGYLGKVNSPYVWSFSNHYTKGKYVRDGVYDPNHVSKQIGTAMLLRVLMDKDSEVKDSVEGKEDTSTDWKDMFKNMGMKFLNSVIDNFAATIAKRLGWAKGGKTLAGILSTIAVIVFDIATTGSVPTAAYLVTTLLAGIGFGDKVGRASPEIKKPDGEDVFGWHKHE